MYSTRVKPKAKGVPVFIGIGNDPREAAVKARNRGNGTVPMRQDRCLRRCVSSEHRGDNPVPLGPRITPNRCFPMPFANPDKTARTKAQMGPCAIVTPMPLHGKQVIPW